MEFRRSRRMGLGADLTPMIDCVFQLLIFFLLSSSFLTPAVSLDLPKLLGHGPSASPSLMVSVDKDNRLYFNKEEIRPSELPAQLKQAFARQKKRDVVFRADEKLPYGKALEVMVLLKKTGANPIHLSYELQEK